LVVRAGGFHVHPVGAAHGNRELAAHVHKLAGRTPACLIACP
jgi:hypothetical protein